MSDRHVLITGGAGYIGSLLTSNCCAPITVVTVLDSLLFGGESLVPFLHIPTFTFVKSRCDRATRDKDLVKMAGRSRMRSSIWRRSWDSRPARRSAGRWRGGTTSRRRKSVFGQAADWAWNDSCSASTYSNYGLSRKASPVTEEVSPLHPQSLYAETKIASEEFLLTQKEGFLRAPDLSIRNAVWDFAAHPL